MAVIWKWLRIMPGQDCVGYWGKNMVEMEGMRGGLERRSSGQGDGWPGGWCGPVVSPRGELEAATAALCFQMQRQEMAVARCLQG